MRAGLLTEQILIERITYIKNIFGANEKKWITHMNTRSIVKFNNGNRKMENNEIVNSYLLSFTISIPSPTFSSISALIFLSFSVRI